MLLSRKLANFTKGEADKLRKAMGKKQIAVMQELKEKFMTNGIANGHPEKTLDKIWKDWEKFAQYAFNKSHATCYAWVSYQTGWLKCHYPSEFFAANLNCNLSNMEELKKIMADCKLHNIKVLNPDVNESVNQFSVNKKGDIRFGLGGLKGFGANVVDSILNERKENGPFADVWDFMERLGNVNRKSLETLVCAGAFDSFGYDRQQFFSPCKNGNLFIDELVHYADLFHSDTVSAETSLFGDMEELKPDRPQMPEVVAEEDILAKLQREKEFVGMYLSAHPLDRYEFEIENFTTCKLADLPGMIEDCQNTKKPTKATIAGIVMDVKTRTTKSGSQGAIVTIEDYTGPYEIALFGKDYERYLPYMQMHAQLFIEGEIAERYMLKPEDRAQGKTAPYSFKLKGMSLLGNVASEHLSNISINIPTDLLDQDFRKWLTKTLKANHGSTPLNITLIDKATGYNLDFHSKKFSVSVTQELISALKLKGLNFRVGKK